MPKTRTLLALVLLPLLVFLVACGGDDDDGGNASNDQPAATDSSSSSDSSNADTSSSDSTDSTDDSSNDSADDVSGEEILANCPELLGMYNAFAGGAFASPGSGEFDLENAAQVWQNAADNAPGEIKADMQVMADAFTNVYTALNDIGVDFSNPASFASLDANQQAQLAAAFESFNTAEIEQAANNLDAWFNENCR
jgi:hypothetical protein